MKMITRLLLAVLAALAPSLTSAQVIDLRQPWLIVATLPATCTYARPLVFVTTAGADFGLHQCNDGALEPVGSGGGSSALTWDGSTFQVGGNITASSAADGDMLEMWVSNTSDTAGSRVRLSAITNGDNATGAASLFVGVHDGGANAANLLISVAGDSGNNTPDTTFTFPGLAVFAGASEYDFGADVYSDGIIGGARLFVDAAGAQNLATLRSSVAANDVDVYIENSSTAASANHIGYIASAQGDANTGYAGYSARVHGDGTNETWMFIGMYGSDDLLHMSTRLDSEGVDHDVFTADPADRSVTFSSTVQTQGYKSADGTSGVTVTTCTSFKNGLCVAGT